MAAPTPSSEPISSVQDPGCADCGAPLTGRFCAQCGEETIDRHTLTLWHFARHNVLHELSHVDGKIFCTFRYLLFRPGLLSAEYFAGRRRRYINPVRLLLTCLVILALVPQPGSMSMSLGRLRLSLLPPAPPSANTIEETIGRLDVFGVLSRAMERVGRHKDLKTPAAVERFNHELKTFGTALSFCNVFLLSGLLAVMYWRRRHLFVEHLVFSLHIASFVLLFSIVPGPLFRVIIWLARGASLSVAAAATGMLLMGIEMIYLYKALLRFYRPDVSDVRKEMRRWSKPAWATRLAVIAIFLANSVFITLTYAAGAAIALWRV